MRTLLSVVGGLLVSSLFAAPVPAEEKPKPRAKLVGTITLNVSVQSAFWTPDGGHLILVTDKRVLVYARDQIGAEKPKALTAFDRPDSHEAVGLTPDGGLFVLAPAGQKVNAENRLYRWNAKALTGGGEPKADKVIDLEADNPQGATPSADGSSLYSTVMTTRPVANANPNSRRGSYEYLPTFLRLNMKTGDVMKRVAFSDLSQDRYAGSTVDPSTGRLYLATHTEAETTVTCREADGKQVWEKKLPVKPDVDSLGSFRLSPDGGKLLFRQPTLTVEQPGGGGNPFGQGGFGPGGGRAGGGGGPARPVSYTSTATLMTFDTKNGEIGPDLSKGDIRGGQGHSFSSDGRLLFASVHTAEGGKLAVWETKTGNEVKAWARAYADVSGAFAPNGYELAIVERDQKQVFGPTQNVPSGQGRDGSQMWTSRQDVVRTEFTSTIGLWDLAPLVK